MMFRDQYQWRCIALVEENRTFGAVPLMAISNHLELTDLLVGVQFWVCLACRRDPQLVQSRHYSLVKVVSWWDCVMRLAVVLLVLLVSDVLDCRCIQRHHCF